MTAFTRLGNEGYGVQRAAFASTPSTAILFTLPLASSTEGTITEGTARKHYYFHDETGVGLKVKAQSTNQLRIDNVTGSLGGYILSNAGASVHVAAIDDTIWAVLAYTGSWTIT